MFPVNDVYVRRRSVRRRLITVDGTTQAFVLLAVRLGDRRSRRTSAWTLGDRRRTNEAAVRRTTLSVIAVSSASTVETDSALNSWKRRFVSHTAQQQPPGVSSRAPRIVSLATCVVRSKTPATRSLLPRGTMSNRHQVHGARVGVAGIASSGFLYVSSEVKVSTPPRKLTS